MYRRQTDGGTRMSEERFDRIDQTLKDISQRLDSVDHRIDDLDRHMHVLHEEAMGRIADIPGYAGATKGEARGSGQSDCPSMELRVR